MTSEQVSVDAHTPHFKGHGARNAPANLPSTQHVLEIGQTEAAAFTLAVLPGMRELHASNPTNPTRGIPSCSRRMAEKLLLTHEDAAS